MYQAHFEKAASLNHCVHIHPWLLTVLVSCLAFPNHSLAQVTPEMCGPITNKAVDYRLPKNGYVLQVEDSHFPPEVEHWIRGSRGYLGQDAEYTITAIPNHHRALASIARQAERLNKDQLDKMRYPVECYFERAIRFRADDQVVRMLYAQYLTRKARPAEAIKQLDWVASNAGDNPFTLQNIGLIYFDMKEYSQALAYAHKAMALGFSKLELRKQLEGVGRWSDAPVERAETPTATTLAPAPAASAATQNND